MPKLTLPPECGLQSGDQRSCRGGPRFYATSRWERGDASFCTRPNRQCGPRSQEGVLSVGFGTELPDLFVALLENIPCRVCARWI